MFIRSLTLYKNRRVSRCKDDKVVKFEFKANLITIIGTIGSGKSSMLNYTTPLITNHTDFRDGGYRILVIDNGNSTYVITNHSPTKNSHSIIKDGVELNESLKAKSYKDIILKEFKITNVLWDIILGNKTFTEASPTERKEWFNLISNTDYEYALNVYKKVSNSLRDYEGAKKLSVTKLNELIKIDQSKLNSLVESRTKYQRLIENKRKGIINLKTPNINNCTLDDSGLESLNDALRAITININTIVNNMNNYSNNSVDEKMELNRLEGEYISKIKECELMMNMEKSSNRYKELKESLDIIETKFRSNITPFNLKEVKSFMKTHGDTLDNVYEELTIKEVNYEDIELATTNKLEEINVLKLGLDKLVEFNMENVLYKRELELEHNQLTKLSLTESISCPSCSTRFKPNYTSLDENKLLTIKNKIKDLESTHTKNMETISNFKTNIKERNNELDLLNKLLGITYKMPIKIEGIFALNDIKLVLHDVKGYEDIKLEMNNINSTKTNFKDIENINSVYDDYRVRLDETRIKINNLIELDKKGIELKRLEENRVIISKNVTELRDYLMQNKKNILLNDDISKYNIELTLLNNEINILELSKSKIRDIEADISKYSSKVLSLKTVQNGLCIKRGIIAKSINNSIGLVINMMNKTIESIIDYDLKVIQPDISQSNNGLTYNFEVLVGDDITPVKDIRLLSSGQKELVNIAFLLVVHSLLELECVIYLDEFGTRLDPYHKVKAMNFVNELTSSDRQIMMITHYRQSMIANASTEQINLSEQG